MDIARSHEICGGSAAGVVLAGQLGQAAYGIEQGWALRENGGQVSGPVPLLYSLALAQTFSWRWVGARS